MGTGNIASCLQKSEIVRKCEILLIITNVSANSLSNSPKPMTDITTLTFRQTEKMVMPSGDSFIIAIPSVIKAVGSMKKNHNTWPYMSFLHTTVNCIFLQGTAY